MNNKLYLKYHRYLTAIHGGKFGTNHQLGILQNILWFSSRQNGDKSHQEVSGACDHTKEVHENHTNQCIIARQQGKYIFLVLINSCFAAMRVYQAANS